MFSINKTAKHTHLWCEEIIKQLVHQGVRHFCIAPGSRSTPIVIAIDGHPLTQTHLHYDERGLGFFALGLSKALLQPIALIVTSGTAVVNLFPAVMEAYQTHTPLIVLTADRPAELRNCRSNQTVDQIKIFGDYVHYFFDFPSPSEEVPTSLVKTQIAQAVHVALVQQGPVHLNIMVREPSFDPSLASKPSTHTTPNKVRCFKPILSLSKEDTSHIAELFTSQKKGLIFASNVTQENDMLAIKALSKKLHFPILAEISSSAHLYLEDFIAHFDLIIKKMKNQKLIEPQYILIMGDLVISKTFLEWIKELKLEMCMQVSNTDSFFDPLHITTHKITSDIAMFCNDLTAEINQQKDDTYRARWTALSNTCKALFANITIKDNAEWLFTYKLLNCIKNIPLFIANSMPIRYANMLYSSILKIGPTFCNRGVSGIDGNIATVAGIACGLNKPIVAILGDTTTLHDLNSLHLLSQAPGAHLFIMNNHGGNIFSHLPIKQLKDIHHKYFYHEHPYSFEQVAAMYGFSYHKIKHLDQLGDITTTYDHSIYEIFISPNSSVESYESFVDTFPLKASIKEYALL